MTGDSSRRSSARSPLRSPSLRYSRQGFQLLDTSNDKMGTNDIPLQTVVSHTPSNAPTMREEKSEKTGLFHRGRRRAHQIDAKTGAPFPPPDTDDEKTALNKMGKFYTKILNFSIVTRYMIYVAPIALILAIPIILSQTGVIKGSIGGTNQERFWIWIEIVWLSFWACKIIAHFLPNVFEFLIGVVSPGVRKYALLLRAVEKAISFVFWMIVNQVTFPVLIKVNKVTDQNNPNGPKVTPADPSWIGKMKSVLLALLVCTCIILGERVLIQLITISYHRKQFDSKIKESKRNIYLLGVLYDASRALFPAYCNEFAEEDYIIQDSLDFTIGSKTNTYKHNRSGSRTPLRLIQDVGRIGDKVTGAFGAVAQEITGKKVFDPNSAHSIVLEALDKNRSAEALAKRIWMSFVVEGKNELYQEDLVEVMGPGREQEAEECFSSLDRDGNGDISLDEMIMTVTEFGRARKSITTSMHDVDQAINALDALLFTIVFIVCIFVFIAFLSPGFTTTLTTSATALLSLSFVFAATCQEVLGSCVFLFVKHPYDIGDRVDIATDQLTVEHISLLYTVFKRVTNGKVVQTPNIVLNNLWVENITRSKAMREQLSIFVAFDTTFDDINTLKQEMLAFVKDPANNRDFHPDIEIEVVSIAEMNKLELRIDIRHKSNWSNEALRASRRSKFMCALVVALRKIPIYGPAGGDVPLGDANKPSWSVALSPQEASAVRQKYLDGKDASRLYPTKIPEVDEKGKSTSSDIGGHNNDESLAIGSLNNRKPGADPVRDDTWNARDDITMGRPSTDARPDLDEVRGMLHKASSGGRRKQSTTPSNASRPSYDQSRPSLPTIHSGIGQPPMTTNPMYAPAPYGAPTGPLPPQPRTPASPSSVSTGNIEEFQYQTMAPPPRSNSRPEGSPSPGYGPTSTSTTNPYRSRSPPNEQRQYRP